MSHAAESAGAKIGKALSILAARLGRASYFMLPHSSAFDMERFVSN